MDEKQKQISAILARYKEELGVSNDKLVQEINSVLAPFDSYSSPNISYWITGKRVPDVWKFKHIWEHTQPGSWLNSMAAEILLVLNPAMITKAE